MFRKLPNNRKKIHSFRLNPLWILLLPLFLSTHVYSYTEIVSSVTNYDDSGDGSLRKAADHLTDKVLIHFETEEDGTIDLLSNIDIESDIIFELSDKNITITGNALNATEQAFFLDGTGEGSLTLSGPEADLTTYSLDVGYTGKGALNITDGGAVTTDSTSIIASGIGSTGTVEVSGENSSYVSAGGLYVGNEGTGTLIVASGGAVTADSISNIGTFKDSTGTVEVSDPDSTYVSTGHLYLGYAGKGALNITDGGAVTTDSISIIGFETSSTGTVTVDGAESSYGVTGNLYVGDSGKGTVNVINGGAVTASSISHIGFQTDSVGTVKVSGEDSKYDATNTLYVGDSGNGTLNVTAGGKATAGTDSYIGKETDSIGTITVSGINSKYDATGTLYVGDSGNGTLNVTNGGAVTASSSSYVGHLADSVGTVNVLGEGSKYDATDTLYIGEYGNGTVNVTESGIVTTDKDSYIGYKAGSVGTVEVNTGGILTVNSGNGTINIASEEGSTGMLKIDGGIINAATISGGNGEANIDFTNNNTDEVTFAPILSGNLSIVQSGTSKTFLTSNNTYTGTTTVSAGELSIGGSNSSAVTVKNGAKLSGNGSVASVTLENGGILSPGNSIGTFSTDTLTMLSGSILDIEVDDRTSYDKVIITGDSGSSVATGSILDLNFTEIGDVSQGDSMSIITATQGVSALDTAGLVTVTNSTGTYATDYILKPYWETVNNDYILFVSLLNAGDYTRLALDSNGYNVGHSLDIIKSNAPSEDMEYVFSILDSVSERGTGEALEQLVHTTDQGVFDTGVAVMKNFQNLQLGRLHNQSFVKKDKNCENKYFSGKTKSPDYSVWAQGFESYLKQNSTDSIVGYQANNSGIALGVDKRLGDNTRAGISFGYSNGKVKGSDKRTQTDIESLQGGVYGGYEGSINPYFIRSAASFAWNEYSDGRKIEFDEVNRLASSEYKGQQCNISLESGYSFIRKYFAVTPIAGIQWNHLHVNDYNETGAQSLNLNVADQNYDLLQSALGGEIAHMSSHPWGGWSCSFYAKWLSDLINDELSLNSSFSEGGVAFETVGGQSEKQHADIGGEFSLGFHDKFFISAEGSVDISKHFRGFYGTTTLRYAF